MSLIGDAAAIHTVRSTVAGGGRQQTWRSSPEPAANQSNEPWARRLSCRLGRAGHSAKGGAYGIVGCWSWLRPYGIAAFAAFCLVQARYRKV